MAAIQERYDVIVVGAGVQGLCAAHTFLSINPSLTLLILDDKSTVGGVWAKSQLYPGLRANNLQGYYEFTDFPILEAGLSDMGLHKRSVLSGHALSSYIYEYAKNFDLLRRTRLKSRVIRATNNTADATNAWMLEVIEDGDDPDAEAGRAKRTISCSKLVVATGQASQPLLPSFPSMDTFRKPIIHSADLGMSGHSLLSDPFVKHVTVLGGSKSAHDAVYMFATGGKRVTWLTRRNGRGTMPMAKPNTRIGPWSVWLEGLLMTRPLSWFGACPWSKGDGFRWVRWALHQTTLGRRLVKGYFENMSADSIHQSGILENKKTAMLVPDHTLMWYGTQASSLNYDADFYDVVSNGPVEVVREDILELNGDWVVLQNGDRIITDMLICATGFDYTSNFPLEPAGQQLRWGVPVPSLQDQIFPALDGQADIELFERFPILSTSPKTTERQPGHTPWRLWRFIAPPSQVCSGERSLAFLCAVASYQTTLKCELTSLWTYAYLFHELNEQPSSEADVMYEAALWSRYGKWRCPMGMQGKIADFLLDSMPYHDLLLRDLGLQSWRKGWGILGEVFGGWYELKDYRGVIDDWVAKRRKSTSQQRRRHSD